MMTVNQLRQDLVLTAGRHDAELGYQLLHSTQQQPQTQTTASGPGRGNRQVIFDQGSNLEQALLATVASTDPKFAYQKAVESLDKGEFPTALSRILTQLQTKDAELFKKLSDKTLNRLASDSLLASREATSVAMNLLQPGPVPASTAGTQPTSTAANTNTRAPISAENRLLQMLGKLWVLPVDIRLSAHSSKIRLRPRSYSYIASVPVLENGALDHYGGPGRSCVSGSS